MIARSIYLAAAWPERARIRALAQELRGMGHHVLSDWYEMEHDHEDYAGLSHEEAVQIARHFFEVLGDVDLMILDTQGESRGGRDFEAGVGFSVTADGLLTGGVWVVGPPTSVFTHLIGMIQERDNHLPFPATWEDVKTALAPVPAHS